jgi:hypothetical protein
VHSAGADSSRKGRLQRFLSWRPYLCAALVAISLAACSETPTEKAQRLDPLLSAAGFQMIPANTAKKQEIASSLPPLKLNYYWGRDGKPHYWLNDPYDCHCVYTGSAKDYQRYQNLRIQQQIAQREEEAASLNQDAAMQMNTFNPFWFPY